VADRCFVCGKAARESDRFVLLRGKRHQVHCSDDCLFETVRKYRAARMAKQLRWSLRLSLTVLVLVGVGTLWLRHRVPRREAISHGWPDGLERAAPPPGPIFFGPPWPPTDEQWTAVFNQASWIFPLPGPNRRAGTIDGQIFGPDPPRDHPAKCREEGRCGVDLGGELWGEHVYAVRDGIVDRVQQDEARDPRGGGQSVRLSHFGGMVFTQYFHLAALPRGIRRGVRVRAGDVIGLVGDTGIAETRRHLHFALSIRPSTEFSEVYWDPTPWLARWPLRLPPHGTVAGFMSSEKDRAELQQRARGR
jgi:hypothetical protein